MHFLEKSPGATTGGSLLENATPEKKARSPMQTYVLYHANCPDGFGAAWAAWMALGSADVNYLPCAYGRPLPASDIPA